MTEDEKRAFTVMFRNSRKPRENQLMPWDSADAAVFAAASPEPDDIDALVLEHARWLDRVREACDGEGLTPNELWQCSLDDDFPSPRARKLWLALGGFCCVPDA